MICTWTGISKDVKTHLQTAHKELCQGFNDQNSLILKIPNASSCSYNKFLFVHNEIFFYRLLIESGIMYVVLHYIGPAENDSKYQYEVTVENDEDTEWVKVTHLARSFTETDDDLLFPKNCLKLHCDHTERFRNEKGELLVLMKILGVGD